MTRPLICPTCTTDAVDACRNCHTIITRHPNGAIKHAYRYGRIVYQSRQNAAAETEQLYTAHNGPRQARTLHGNHHIDPTELARTLGEDVTPFGRFEFTKRNKKRAI